MFPTILTQPKLTDVIYDGYSYAMYTKNTPHTQFKVIRKNPNTTISIIETKLILLSSWF